MPKPFSLVCFFFFLSQLSEQIFNTIRFWLFIFFYLLVITFSSFPFKHLIQIYLRILQLVNKTVHCCKQFLISDYYIFKLKYGHFTYLISHFIVWYFYLQDTGNCQHFSLTSFCLIQQEGCLGWQSKKKKQNHDAFLGLFRRAGI